MIKTSNVADLHDQADRRDKGDPAQRLQRLHHRRPPPVGDGLSQLRGDPRHAAFRFVNRVAIFLERDVLRRQREAQIREPAAIRLGPPGTAGIPAPLPLWGEGAWGEEGRLPARSHNDHSVAPDLR